MQDVITAVKSMFDSAGYGPMSIVFSFVLGTLSAVASACCTLPLMGAVAGYSIAQDDNRQKALQSALMFMAGVVATLLAIGWIIIFFGQSAIRVSGGYWKIAAGSIALIFGIVSLRLLPFSLPKLPSITLSKKPGTIVSGLTGVIFGGTIAVTSLPCNPGIFVVLGAAMLEKHTFWATTTLFAYAIGFSVPLSALVFGLSFGKSAIRLGKAEKIIRISAGILLIAAAVYLFYTYCTFGARTDSGRHLTTMTNNNSSCDKGLDVNIPGVPPVCLSSTMTVADRYGSVMCRLSDKFRMRYIVTPGLYALGKPDQNSPVLVTANYRLSLHALRMSLASRNVWILVIDTKGINVWCAAGKGTFCTNEIVKQLSACNLKSIISHRTLILPQLGASGVSASKLQKASGFSVKFGPVRASDIPAYLDNNYTASPAMRRVRFSIVDRAKLVPMETIPAFKKIWLFLLITAVLFGMTRTGIIYRQALIGVLPLVIAGLAALFTGTILLPLLLPYLPGRAFSLKGFVTGLTGAIAIIFLLPICRSSPFLTVFNLVSVPAFSSYLAFLFTGCSTYTSPSGVKTELKIAWPLYLASAAVSTILLIIQIIRFWRVL